jgi:hypothetical protein
MKKSTVSKASLQTSATKLYSFCSIVNTYHSNHVPIRCRGRRCRPLVPVVFALRRPQLSLCRHLVSPSSPHLFVPILQTTLRADARRHGMGAVASPCLPVVPSFAASRFRPASSCSQRQLGVTSHLNFPQFRGMGHLQM